MKEACTLKVILAINVQVREGLKFDMKYHIFLDFRTSTPFKGKSSDHFKDPHKLKLLTNFDVNLTSSPGGIMN